MPASIIWNKKPLLQNSFAPLPPTAIHPDGWLRERVEAEAQQNVHMRILRACLLGDTEAMDALQAEMLRLIHQDSMPSNEQIRALLVYHAVTVDKEAALYLLRYAKSLRDRLVAGEALAAQTAADIGDLLHMALWLYNLTEQKGLLELCRMLKAQAPDWMSTFHIFPQTKAVRDLPDPQTDAHWRVYGPTVAASLKTPGLQALFEGGRKNETAFNVGWEKLRKYHGAGHGLFNADPYLAGGDPARSIAPLAVSELMYSAYVQLWTMGQPEAGDLMETIACNALGLPPAGQAANQLAAEGKGGAGMALYAASLWMAAREDGLVANGYAPSTMRWRAGGKPVRITTQTNYPAEETISMKLQLREPVHFTLHLRIPQWAEGAAASIGGETIPCEAGTFAAIERDWQDGDEILLTLPMQVATSRQYHQSVSISRGPVAYALPVEEGAQWQVALLPDAVFELDMASGIPMLYTQAAEIEWNVSGDHPGAPPILPQVEGAAQRRIGLVPYGTCGARIAQFPMGALQRVE